MRALRSFFARLAALFTGPRRDRDLTDELESHLQLHVDDNLRRGMSPEEARRQAVIGLGGVEQTKESYRDRRSLPALETLLQDIRFGARMLAKSPTLTAVVVITLALGIGANTAIFSMVNGFLLRPLPVPEPEQITALAIQQKDAPVGSSGFSYPEFVDFRKQADGFSDLFADVLTTIDLRTDDRSEQCFANYVSGNFFSALRIRPALGRFILPGEAETPGGQTLAVLGYSYWQKRFRGDPEIIGKQILVDDKPATIIGIVEKQFHGMYSIFELDVYLPISAMTLEVPPNLLWNSRDLRRLLVFGRRKPEVSLSQAQSSLDVISVRLARQYPATDTGITVRAVPEKLARPIPYANNAFIAISGLFLALAGFVLLLACMNVEHILLARGTLRRREMAIRAALGAGRRRLIQQLLTESILLAVFGGVAGIALGVWASSMSSAIHPANLPLHLDSAFDWRVFAYATACALSTGIIVGLWPAMRASSTDVNSVLHDGGQNASTGADHLHMRNFLVVAQVAGSLTLLIIAGLFVRSLRTVQRLDLGFDPGHVLNVILDPHENGYDQPRTTEFYRALEARVRALPGIQSVSLASNLPMASFPKSALVSIEGRPLPPDRQPPKVLCNSIDPPYFETMRVGILRGRSFTESDGEGAPLVAIVNQTMAARFWPSDDPIGKRFSVSGATGPFLEVVGVSKTGKYQTIAEDAQSYFYVPLAQNFASRRALQIRSFLEPESLAGPVKEEIQRLAPDVSIVDIETMKQSLEGGFGFFAFRLAAILAAAMGIIGLILAVVGVYGLISFAASQRTREIGICMALGANPSDILNLVLRQGVRLVVAGVILGMIAAWALARTMGHLLVGISPSDPVTYASVAILLGVVALVACWIPARRATRVDPIVALRHE
jgi:predicted permease